MKKKKLIWSKRTLSWLLAVTLAGISLTLPVQASDFTDETAVEAAADNETEVSEDTGEETESSEESILEEDIPEENIAEEETEITEEEDSDSDEESETDFDAGDSEEEFSAEEENAGNDFSDTDNQALAREGAELAVKHQKQKYASGFTYKDIWGIYTLLRHGETVPQKQKDAFYDEVAAQVKTWDRDTKPTYLAGAALGITIIGKDITDVEGVNLAELMYNASGLTDGSNELTWVLLALDAANVTIPDNAKWNREKMVNALIDRFQNPSNGGIGLFDNRSADVDLTGMALQALARYRYSSEKVSTAVDRALTYLRNQMTDDCGYRNSYSKDGNPNPNSTAEVLLAVVSLGIDPTSEESGFGSEKKNMITHLMKYAVTTTGGEGFAYTTSTGKKVNDMATYQVLEALDAYLMFVNEDRGYWDLGGTSHVAHKWTGEIVVKQPTCTEKGSKVSVCSICGQKRTVSIPATGHKWSQWQIVSKATVLQKEIQRRSCSVCKKTETREVGNKVTPTAKISASSLPLKVKQTIRNFRVTGMVKGDSVQSWKSSNTKIVKVTGKEDGTCRITAQKRTGKAKITITLKSGLQKVLTVKVQKSAVKIKKINRFKDGKKSIILKKGQKYTLTPLCTPISCVQKANYTSSNKKVAKVDSKGRIKARKPGKTIITIKIGNKKAKFKVTVKK